MVDADLAGFLWGGRDPIGRRFRPESSSPWFTGVGVVEDLKLRGRDDREIPSYQFLRLRDPAQAPAYVAFAMRTSGPPERLLPLFEQALWSVDPEQSYSRLRTAEDALAEYEDRPRFLTGLIGALALVAVTLAAVGLYGVLAYAVTRRRQEIGIRIAIGAQPARVRRTVLGEGMAVAAVGAAIGLVAAYALARSLEPFLFAVDPRDLTIFAATATLFLTVAVVASIFPAQRATRVDPVEVLKAE